MDGAMKRKLPYQHGGSPRLDLARLGLAERPLLDFSVNLNFFGPPPIIKERWMEMLGAIESYPSVDGKGVSYFYRKKYGIPSKNFLAGNGSTEMIYLVSRVLGLKKITIVAPSYHDYERASILSGAEVSRLVLSPETLFSGPHVDQLTEALKNADAIWLGRPNNPTGTLFPKRPLMELAREFPGKWFIIDEAFIQFVEGYEEETFLTEKPLSNLLVIHSLTKFYAVAGLRLGGIMGNEETLSLLRAAREPWAVNGIADRVSPLLLQCADYEQETRSTVIKERERVFHDLERLDGITPFPATANFILCRWTGTNDLDDLMRHLLSNGIYVRDCRNFAGLEDNYFRIGLRGTSENDQLLSILSAFPYV